MNPAIKNLTAEYKKRKPEIDKRLKEFKALYGSRDEDIFAELCFCILTANANALLCNDAICELKDKGLILRGARGDISAILKGKARFHNNKADYILKARDILKSGDRVNLKDRLKRRDVVATRDWLVGNIKGFGYKEASHFLRNVGLGDDIAILDRHILKNLKRYGVIKKIPASISSRKAYVEIEERMKNFSKEIRIPLAALDLLFWYLQTGFVFK